MPRGVRWSTELKEAVLRWKFIHNLEISKIEELSGIPERTLYSIFRTYRIHGQVDNPFPGQGGVRRILSEDDVAFISGILQANPCLYLDEILRQLRTARGVDVSCATLSRELHHRSITNKKVHYEAKQRNEMLRAVWRNEHGNIPMEYCVYIDESAVDERTAEREYGWQVLGRACVRRAAFIRGKRYSLLPALTADGIITLELFEGSVTKERFIGFLRDNVAPKLTPFPGPRSVVIMDNCTIHHDAEIRAIIEDECGARLIYLPPYSPDMNPIEQAFASIKAFLARHEGDAVNPIMRPWVIDQAVASITPEDAQTWIAKCGYASLADIQ